MNSLIIAGNIVKRAFRSKKELLALLILPVVAIGVMTFVINGMGEEMPVVGIVNQDNGYLGERFASYIQGRAGAQYVMLEPDSYRQDVEGNKVAFGVVVPADFTVTVDGGQKGQVTLYGEQRTAELEGFRQVVNQYMISMHAANKTAAALAAETGREQRGIMNSILDRVEQGSLAAEVQLAGSDDTTEDRQEFTSVIGFALIFIMILVFTVIGTIMEDKKKLTLARMFVAPIKQWEIVAGNLLGGLMLGTLQLVPILTVLKFVFDIPWGTQFLGVALIFFSFLLTTIGLGIGLSGIVKNSFNPTMITATVIVPSSILGGVFIPASMMPEIMSKLGYAVPQRWVMNGIQQILAGAAVSEILLNVGIILMFGLAFATFGARTIKPLNE